MKFVEKRRVIVRVKKLWSWVVVEVGSDWVCEWVVVRVVRS